MPRRDDHQAWNDPQTIATHYVAAKVAAKITLESDATDDSLDQVIGGFERRIIEPGVLAGDDFAGVALDLADKDRLAGLEIGDCGHSGIPAGLAGAGAKGRTRHHLLVVTADHHIGQVLVPGEHAGKAL